MVKWWPALAIMVLFGFHCVLAATLPPADDELYYWCWSQELQPSYYDHPPMVAYLIRITTDLFGNTLFAVRLPACLCSLGSLLLLARLIRPISYLPLLFLMPLYSVGAILITPDAPLLLFWTAYLYWLVRLHESPQPRLWQWALGGIILGCGILSKYTMGLSFGIAMLSLLVHQRHWRWLPGYLLHLVVAFIVTLPILIYNIRQDFAPILYQWHHAMQTAAPTVRHFPEFVGVQVLLAGVLPFVLVIWVWQQRKTIALDPRLRVCAWMFVLPFLFFLSKAARGRLEGNWALVSYLAFWPLAIHTLHTWSQTRRRWALVTFTVPAAVSILVLVHVTMPLSLVPASLDRLTRLKSKYEAFSELGKVARALPDTPLAFTPSYQLTAQMRFQGIATEQIEGITRPSHFTLKPQRLQDQQQALVIVEGGLPPVLLIGFEPPELLGEYPVQVREHLSTKLYLFRLTRHQHAAR